MENIITIIDIIEATKPHSAWDRGVREYALELLDELKDHIESGYIDDEDLTAPKLLESHLLNGARDWNQYSRGGCSLIFNQDIAKRLATATELAKTRDGMNPPNSREEWIDTQARALYQAARLIIKAATENSFVYTKPITGRTYQEKKESARDIAIAWQNIAATRSLYMSEYADAAEYFERIGRRYGLTREFIENGII